MLITLDDAERFRQWFDQIYDVSPEFLDSRDYTLGLSLHDACGVRTSSSLQKDANAAAERERQASERAELTAKEPESVPGRESATPTLGRLGCPRNET